ncbi:MAG: T9SS type A sorting domain-containing protein [Bacteroidales bacterium]|nr:T9SS type A sorting domain-containing protein [Bacteroidales bacterium]
MKPNVKLEKKSGLSLRSVGCVSMKQSPSLKKMESKSDRRQTLNRRSVKKVFLTVAIFAITGNAAKAQIELTYSGNVGMGINPTWVGCKLRVAYGGNDFAFIPNHCGVNFGARNASAKNATRIDFWHPTAEWNKVRFRGYTLGSDSTLKTEIIPLESATDILKQIKTYSYYFKSDCIDTRQKEYGVLAQELEDVLPELIDTAKETMLVNYNAFFAFLIKGFNEQQELIETQQQEVGQLQMDFGEQQQEIIQLRDSITQHRQEINQHQQVTEILQQIIFSQEMELNELRNTVDNWSMLFEYLQNMILNCCDNEIFPRGDSISVPKSNSQSKTQQEAILYQNTPNPFSSNTEIACYIPAMKTNAYIHVYSLQGVKLKSFTITQTGHNTVIVSASELAVGMYLYTLVVDNELIDSKRMILTK